MKRSLYGRVQLKVRRRFPSRKARRHELVGPPEYWRQKRAFQIDFLKRNGLTPSNTLVDIGCGTLRGGIPLIDFLDTGHYTGVDVRSEIEGEARAELREHHLENKSPNLAFGRTLADTHLGQTFDVAWAFAVLFHLTDDNLAECFAFVAEHLAPTGTFFANANLGRRAPNQWREFPELWRELDEYTAYAAAAGLQVEDLGRLDSLGHDFVGQAQHMMKFTIAPA